MRVEDEEVVFDVYKAPIIKSHYKDLCMINVIEGDKCGVVSPRKTSLDYLIEQTKLLLPKLDLMLIDEPKKAKLRNLLLLKIHTQNG